MIRTFFFAITAVIADFAFAQITINPIFPTVDDVITVTYDASQGNAALIGSTQVYMHAGLITDQSTSATDWQHVQGVWGTADPEVAMTYLGNNLHTITIDIDQFFGFPLGTVVEDLAFVFRNATGSIVGRSADNSDIYYPIYPNNGELFVSILSPSSNAIYNLGDQVQVDAQANHNADISLYLDGNLEANVLNASSLTHSISVTSPGNHMLVVEAVDANYTKRDTVNYVVNPSVLTMEPPAGMLNGINYTSDTSVLLKLFAPDKQNIYVIGDFNNWTVDTAYYMKRSADNATWWIEISGLTAGQKYGYQYFIDGEMKLADPLSTLILDPNNDNAINAITYPDRLVYPYGKTTGFVTVIQPGAPTYQWQNTTFTPAANKDLIIYEVLVRDFVASRNYLTMIDTLPYLKKLGINAIELMPVGEFENNESWGYNPSFHMALDKYYGTPEHFKAFIDSCHALGIAVILDIALNHTFGQSPMVNMYWDAVNNRPAANNPWFNAICPHEPYCWGYDLNHEVQATKDYVNRINKYWLEEYHLDGFRFDYTKGFVNNGNGYSDTRINILKGYADTIWALKPNAKIILEHWCDNAEEEQLADYGMMLWGNVTYNYHQAGIGNTGSSNLSSGLHVGRGWSQPHLISYIESHDEERFMYETLTYGLTTNPAHNPRDLETALDRAQAAAVIMLTSPGPKMIWQFGELGYDVSIDVPCRVCNKPILWNYYLNEKRRQLYDVYAATLHLRNTYPTFRTLDFSYYLSAPVKRLTLNDPSMNALVLANFSVQAQTNTPNFTVGTWYEYFTGDTLIVTTPTQSVNLNPGEYRIYTTEKIPQAELSMGLNVDELFKQSVEFELFPNPTQQEIHLSTSNVLIQNVIVLDVSGKVVQTVKKVNAFQTNLQVADLEKGMYVVLIETNKGFAHKEFIKQ